MWKVPLNPVVVKALLSCRKRSMNLSDIKVPIDLAVPALGNGKLCAWCLSPLTGRKYKWCSSECGNSAFAYANPQSEYGLQYLLSRQDFRCSSCQYDYSPLAQSLLGTRGIPKLLPYRETFSIRFMKPLKRQSPKGTRPEVDHVQPVALGGVFRFRVVLSKIIKL